MRAERQDIGIGDVQAGRSHRAGDPLPVRADRADLRSIGEPDAQSRSCDRELGREDIAISRFVLRQPQSAGEIRSCVGQRRFGGDATPVVQSLIGDPELSEHLHVPGDVVKLFARPEQLQRAPAAFVVGNACLRAQFSQGVPAVFRQRHHAGLVKSVTP